MAYRFVPCPVALNDIALHDPEACCRTYQMQFDEHFCVILHGFD